MTIVGMTVERHLLTSSLTAGSPIRAVGPGPTLIQDRLHPPGLAVLHLAACTCNHSKLRRRRAEDDCATANLEEEEQRVTALSWPGCASPCCLHLHPQQVEKKKSREWLHSPGLAVLHLAACTRNQSNSRRKRRRRRAEGDCALLAWLSGILQSLGAS